MRGFGAETGPSSRRCRSRCSCRRRRYGERTVCRRDRAALRRADLIRRHRVLVAPLSTLLLQADVRELAERETLRAKPRAQTSSITPRAGPALLNIPCQALPSTHRHSILQLSRQRRALCRMQLAALETDRCWSCPSSMSCGVKPVRWHREPAPSCMLCLWRRQKWCVANPRVAKRYSVKALQESG